MSMLSRHPYRDIEIILSPLSSPDVNIESFRLAGQAVASGLINKESLDFNIAILGDLVAKEFGQLQFLEEPFRNALACTSDWHLQKYAKNVDSRTAWAIFDLIFLSDLDNKILEHAAHWPDPAGLIAPFISNSATSTDQIKYFANLFAKSADRARNLCAGTMIFKLADTYLRGVLDAQAPDLALLTPNCDEPPIAIGALIRHLALNRRLNLSNSYRYTHAISWLTSDSTLMKPLLSTRAMINEVLRDDEENKLFIIGVLLDLDTTFTLERPAKNQVLKIAEEIFFTRFSSVLSSTDFLGATNFHFRPYEFAILDQIVKVTNLDAYRFEETFLNLASDGYFRLLHGPALYESERSRATYLLALAALASNYHKNDDLVDAVNRCNDQLKSLHFGGHQLVSETIFHRVLSECNLDLPRY